MNVFEMIIAIVLVVTIGRLIERRITRGRRDDDHPAFGKAGEDPERLRQLEQRVEVLERIVTDQGYELRQKFRDLEG